MIVSIYFAQIASRKLRHANYAIFFHTCKLLDKKLNHIMPIKPNSVIRIYVRITA